MIRVESSDIDGILERGEADWQELRNKNLFVTGGTGFFGCWILESLLAANYRFGLNAKAVVLTRDPDSFRAKAPHLAGDGAVTVISGDVRRFSFPDGRFDWVIHAATEASAKLAAERPLEMYETVVEGTRRVLEFARTAGTRNLLLTSSGAIYGRQPHSIPNVDEEYAGAPDPCQAGSVYGTAKRAAEQLCSIYAARYGIECKIARCFAFVGPHLPLDSHFAIGNFIRDAMAGREIGVTGDGSVFRSYLYAADLAEWLWTIFVRGRSCHPYNVGSGEAISIEQLAHLVVKTLAVDVSVRIDGKRSSGRLPERYVPSVARAEAELGLRVRTTLPTAIARTALWYSRLN
jgi:nucleoside-diphosphate-sugar epimerase